MLFGIPASLPSHGKPEPKMLTVHRIFRRSTTGDLSDPNEVAGLRDQWLPPTAVEAPTVAVLDLSGRLLSPSSLHELIVPLGQRLRGGSHGSLKLVVVSADDATRRLVALLAEEYEIPLFVAQSPLPVDLEQAVPVGDLTTNDTETLHDLAGAGWQLTVSRLARHAGIAQTTANNRLVSLERKGYVYRVHRHRRHGDLFVDPRAPGTVNVDDRPAAPAMRSALVAAGIQSDPYDRQQVVLEGRAADRALEVLRRRTEGE